MEEGSEKGRKRGRGRQAHGRLQVRGCSENAWPSSLCGPGHPSGWGIPPRFPLPTRRSPLGPLESGRWRRRTCSQDLGVIRTQGWLRARARGQPRAREFGGPGTPPWGDRNQAGSRVGGNYSPRAFGVTLAWLRLRTWSPLASGPPGEASPPGGGTGSGSGPRWAS